MSDLEVFELLDELGVTVTLDRPTGELHARPRPIPERARELLRANRAYIAVVLARDPSCSSCGATDAPYLVPAHWDPTLELCSDCCRKLDADGEIPDSSSEPVENLNDAVESLATFGSEVVATYEHDEHGQQALARREYAYAQARRVPRYPSDTPVELTPTEIRVGYGNKAGKARTKTITHVRAPCDVCRQPVMRPANASPKKCILTPGCEGKHDTKPKQPKPNDGPPRHPAKFSPEILAAIAAQLPPTTYPRMLDPFAGQGGIHDLANDTTGVELEPEWACARPGTLVGDALALPFGDDTFDAIATSPTYGNRLADSHNVRDGSVRHSYTHDLGRNLHSHNSGAMHWGPQYRLFHRRAWAEVVRVLRPGGRFVLNVSDHIRNKQRQPVTAWHVDILSKLGLVEVDRIDVPTKRLRFGANDEARVEVEHVIVFKKPSKP